jgi:hypothetical protein
MSDSKIGVEALYSVFDELGTLILKGYFSKVDNSSYMKNIYLLFLEKIILPSDIVTGDKNLSASMIDIVISQVASEKTSKLLI